MNKSKRPMTNRLRKKMAKEIRLAQPAFYQPEPRQYSNELTPQELLKKYPKKLAKKQKELLNSATKSIALKKKKHKKLSKRTNPGDVPGKISSPGIVHKEGRHWIKTLTKQSIQQRKVLMKKGKLKK
jgi:hypothetical protein